MSVTSTHVPSTPSAEPEAREAPLTLTTEPPRPLRFTDQLAMWANLGISLFGPLTGALVATTAGTVGLAIGAIVVGCVLGAVLLGASAIFGVATGAPAMVALRGLLRGAHRAQHCAEHRVGDHGDLGHLQRGGRHPR